MTEFDIQPSEEPTWQQDEEFFEPIDHENKEFVQESTNAVANEQPQSINPLDAPPKEDWS